MGETDMTCSLPYDSVAAAEHTSLSRGGEIPRGAYQLRCR
jgi:hypothetical protein